MSHQIIQADIDLINKHPLWRREPHLFCTIVECRLFPNEVRTFLVKVTKGRFNSLKLNIKFY